MKQERRGLYHYLRFGPEREIEVIYRTSARLEPVPPPYIEVMCQHCIDQLGVEPRNLCWDGEHLGPKTSIRLSANIGLVKADGIDTAKVEVKGLPDDIEDVELTVNGKSVRLPRGECVELSTKTPGKWIVALSDTRFATGESVTIKSVAVDEYEAAMNPPRREHEPWEDKEEASCE